MTYACKNSPRPVAGSTYPAQDGWTYANGTRTPILVDIPHVMTTECEYSRTTIDVQCDGCGHRNNEGGL